MQINPQKTIGIFSTFNDPIEKAIADFDFNLFSDTFLTYLYRSTSQWRNNYQRHKAHKISETDRVSAMASELKKLGQTVIENEDLLKITSDRNTLIEKAKEALEQRKNFGNRNLRRSPICYEFWNTGYV